MCPHVSIPSCFHSHSSVSRSKISMIHPEAVTSCNVDLENLISDTNRSIATLAITTLLKVCVCARVYVCACMCVSVGMCVCVNPPSDGQRG